MKIYRVPNERAWIGALLIVLTLVALLAGCGGGGGGGTGGGTGASSSSSGGSSSSSSNPNFNDSAVANITYFSSTVKGPQKSQAPVVQAPGDPASQANPAVASSGDGFLYTLADSDENTGNGRDIVGQRTNMTTGALLWSAAGLPLCTATGEQLLPAACVETGGRLVGVWQDQRAVGNGNAHVYLGRLDVDGNKLDGQGVIVSTADPSVGEETQPGCVATTSQRVWVWWYQSTGVSVALVDCSGATPTVVFRTSLTATSGAAAFQAPNPGAQLAGIVASDGALIVALVMTFTTSANFGLYAQRVELSGVQGWNNGQPLKVSDAANRQREPALCSNGAGGAYFCWRDDRNPADPLNDPQGQASSQAFFQHVTAAGSVRLADNGELVMSPSSGRKLQTPAVAFDGTTILLAADSQGTTQTDHALVTTTVVPSAVAAPGQRAPISDGGTVLEATTDFTAPKLVADSGSGHHLVLTDSQKFLYRSFDSKNNKFANPTSMKFSVSGTGMRNPQVVEVAEGTVGIACEAKDGSGRSKAEGRPVKKS